MHRDIKKLVKIMLDLLPVFITVTTVHVQQAVQEEVTQINRQLIDGDADKITSLYTNDTAYES